MLISKGDKTKTIKASKKWLLIIISLLFLSLAIWAVTYLNGSSSANTLTVVENANDVCYEQPIDTGLCIGFLCIYHKQTIPIRNLSIDSLTDMKAVIDTSGLNIGVLNGCGIDNVSGHCSLQSLIDLGSIIGVLNQGIIYDPMPDYGANDLHSIYNASLLSINIFSGQNLYATYTKNGQQYVGQINPCATTPFPIFGNFNVERNTPDYTNGDYRLYTQATGKPFDLQAVFYKEDYTTKTAFNGDVQIELVDAGINNETSYNTTNCRSFKSVDVNQTVYLNNQVNGAAFPLTPNKAIKNAAMRVWAFKYKDDSSIVEYHCTPAACYKSIYVQYYKKYGDTTCANFCQTTNSERECYGCLAGNYAHATCSRDNFAIRPDGLRLRVGDNNQGANLTNRWITGNQNNPTRKNLVSGYNYPIEINATKYNSNALADGYYNINANETIIPNSDLSLIKSTGNLLAIAFSDDVNACNDTTHRQLRTSVLLNGTNSARDMLYRDDVGDYDLWMIDNIWTRVDWDTAIKPRFAGFQNLIDCTPGSSDSENYKIGCATSSDKGTANFSNIPIRFVPYNFDLTAISYNISDWLYMSDIETPGGEEMAVKLMGAMIAKNAKNSNTSNFVKDCAAQNVKLRLDFNSTAPAIMQAQNLNDKTTRAVRLRYRMQINNDGNNAFGDANRSKFITVSKDKFLKVSSGAALLDIRYNITKLLDRVLNPVKIMFKSLLAISDDINASANMKDDFHPEGNIIYNKPYTFLYSRVYTPFEKATPSVTTLNTKATMSVIAYCDTSCAQYSALINTANIIDSNWFRVNVHLADTSGLIQSLSANKPLTTITPHTNVKFVNNGATDPVTIGYPMNKRPQLVRITIVPDLWLKYHPDIAQNGNPFFDIKFTAPEYEWAGVGKTGNVIKSKPTPNPNRLSW